jgi:hypothetical protein
MPDIPKKPLPRKQPQNKPRGSRCCGKLLPGAEKARIQSACLSRMQQLTRHAAICCETTVVRTHISPASTHHKRPHVERYTSSCAGQSPRVPVSTACNTLHEVTLHEVTTPPQKHTYVCHLRHHKLGHHRRQPYTTPGHHQQAPAAHCHKTPHHAQLNTSMLKCPRP